MARARGRSRRRGAAPLGTETGRRTTPPPRSRGEEPRSRKQEDAKGAREPVVVGLLAAPGLVYELAEELARDLPRLLAARFPEVAWQVVLRPEPMAAASESDVDLVEIARQRMLAEGWKLAVCLTDFPLHVGNRPVTAHASATAGVGLISVPALGAVNLDEHLREAVLRVIEGLLGESVDDLGQARDGRRRARMRNRLEELATSMRIGRAEVREGGTMSFVAAVGLGDLRLLVGMVRANRPWRLIAGLSRAIVAALGLDIFGVASPGVWMIADGMGWVRLLIVGVASIIVTSFTLIAVHGLWEKTYNDRVEIRERTVLFNLATALTVAIGVISLHVVLFIINIVSAAVLITGGVLERQLGHPADAAAYVAVAWLVTSLATLGGALGAALENDRAVREAAYGYRPDARNEAMPQQPAPA